MSPDWKEVVRTLVEMHSEYGAAVVNFDADIPNPDQEDPVLVTPEEEIYREQGSDLTPKKVRGWLWHNRKKEWSEPVPNAVLFSAIDPDTEESVIGIAHIPEPEVE